MMQNDNEIQYQIVDGQMIIDPYRHEYTPLELRQLLEMGANPNHELSRGNTAYLYYVNANWWRHVMELIRCGHLPENACIDVCTSEDVFETAHEMGRDGILKLMVYTRERANEAKYFEDSVVTVLCMGKKNTHGIGYDVWKVIARMVFDSRNEGPASNNNWNDSYVWGDPELMYDTVLMCQESVTLVYMLGKRRAFGLPYDVWRIIAGLLMKTQLEFNWILTPRDRRLGVHTWIDDPNTYKHTY